MRRNCIFLLPTLWSILSFVLLFFIFFPAYAQLGPSVDPDEGLYEVVITTSFTGATIHRDTVSTNSATTPSCSYFPDANGDGKVNMLDAGALFIEESGEAIKGGLGPLGRSGDDTHSDAAWGCLIENYQPTLTPTAIPIASADTIELEATLQDLRLRADGKHEAPYRVALKRLPEGFESMQIFGVVFSRPIPNSDHVFAIYPEFNQSKFVREKEAVWMQAFYRPLNPSVNGKKNQSYACWNNEGHSLDVGIFNTRGVSTLSVGQTLLDCIVILEDVILKTNSGALLFHPELLYTFNVVLYVLDDTGEIRILSGTCTPDILPAKGRSEKELSAQLVKAGKINLSPNPVQQGGSLSISWEDVSSQPVSLSLSDLSGKTYWSGKDMLTKGTEGFQIPAGNLAPGIYLLRIKGESVFFTEKIVISR